MDKAQAYAAAIRRLLLQFDGIETKTRATTPAAEQQDTAPAVVYKTMSEQRAGEAVYKNVTTGSAGLTAGEISDIFERDARRY